VSKYKVVCLLSGGMDSTTSLAFALRAGKDVGMQPSELLSLSFNYGQRHGERELTAAQEVATHYGVSHSVIDLSSLRHMLAGSALTDRSIAVPDGHYTEEVMRVTVVPNRNAIMLSIAFGIARAAGATEVYAGMHAGDHYIYPDCRESFVDAFQWAMNEANEDILATAPITLHTPFISMMKWDIAELGFGLGVPFNLTYSCYNGGRRHCGTCGTCVERREAFEKADVPDPTQYEPVAV
jgi:7-cyano-7-deazaguanine synthase